MYIFHLYTLALHLRFLETYVETEL